MLHGRVDRLLQYGTLPLACVAHRLAKRGLFVGRQSLAPGKRHDARRNTRSRDVRTRRSQSIAARARATCRSEQRRGTFRRMQQPGEADLYTRLAPFYDWMSRGLLAPFGGDTRFRTEVVEMWNIRPGDRVLELGCGTGLMTRQLLDRGAVVTGVDRSPPMLARARNRAPEATFVEHDVPTFRPDGVYDRVILSYILHELDRDARAMTLAMARDALAPGGLVGIVDFDDSAREPVRTLIDLYLRVAEPPSAREWARQGFREEVASVGLRVVRGNAVGWGTARAGLLAPARSDR